MIKKTTTRKQNEKGLEYEMPKWIIHKIKKVQLMQFNHSVVKQNKNIHSCSYLDFATRRRASSLVLAFSSSVLGRLLFLLFLCMSLSLCKPARSVSSLKASLHLLHFAIIFILQLKRRSFWWRRLFTKAWEEGKNFKHFYHPSVTAKVNVMVVLFLFFSLFVTVSIHNKYYAFF